MEVPAFFKLRTAIHSTEVKPPQPVKYSLPNPLHIVNSYADFRHSPYITWEQLTQAYPLLEGMTEPAGKVKVTTSVHCECTVAVHIAEKFREREELLQPSVVEIGISKLSCWFCEKYLEFLVQSRSGFRKKMKFVVTGYQGKIHPGWICPPLGPLDAIFKMTGLVRHEVDEVLERVMLERRSDSFLRYSSGADDDDDGDNEQSDKADLEGRHGFFV